MTWLHPLLTKSQNYCGQEGQGTQPQGKMQLHRDKPSTLWLQVPAAGYSPRGPSCRLYVILSDMFTSVCEGCCCLIEAHIDQPHWYLQIAAAGYSNWCCP